MSSKNFRRCNVYRIVYFVDRQRQETLLPLFRAVAHFEVSGVAKEVEEVQSLCATCEADVLIVDRNSADYFPLISQVNPTSTLIISQDNAPANALNMLHAGARGYLLRENITTSSLIHSTAMVAKGMVCVDPALLPYLLRLSPVTSPPDLDESERMLLRGIACGLNNKQIALQLNVSNKTISNRLSLLYNKIDVQGRVQAAFYALRIGLVSAEEVV